MIRIKKGVRLGGIRPEMSIALAIVESVYSAFGYDVVITSALDGRHKVGSLHYSGQGLDIRTRHIETDAEKQEIRARLSDALGEQYDVVLESDHIHLEFDPK